MIIPFKPKKKVQYKTIIVLLALLILLPVAKSYSAIKKTTIPTAPDIQGDWVKNNKTWLPLVKKDFKKNNISENIDSIWQKKISFYMPNTYLLEVRIHKERYFYYYIANTKSNESLVILDGTGNPVHKANVIYKIHAQSPNEIKNYLKFFVSSLAGKEKNIFYIIDKDSTFISEPLKEKIPNKETTASKSNNNKWNIKSNVILDDIIYDANFEVDRNYSVSILNNTATLKINPLTVYHENFRRFDEVQKTIESLISGAEKNLRQAKERLENSKKKLESAQKKQKQLQQIRDGYTSQKSDLEKQKAEAEAKVESLENELMELTIQNLTESEKKQYRKMAAALEKVKKEQAETLKKQKQLLLDAGLHDEKEIKMFKEASGIK